MAEREGFEPPISPHAVMAQPSRNSLNPADILSFANVPLALPINH